METVRPSIWYSAEKASAVYSAPDGVVTVALYAPSDWGLSLFEVRTLRLPEPITDRNLLDALAKEAHDQWDPPEGVVSMSATQAKAAPLSAISEEVTRLHESPTDPDDQIPFPTLAEIDRIASEAEPAEFGLRSSRDIRAHVTYALAASLYELAWGSSLSEVARALGGVDVAEVRSVIARARRNGYLTSVSQGRKGGVPTKRATELVIKAREWLDSHPEGEK